MDDFTASVLVFTVFFPAVAAFVALLTVQRESVSQARFVALAATAMTFVSSLILIFAFDRSPGLPGDQFQFESQATWIDAATAGFDVQFHMGVDGLGMTMVFLTTFLFGGLKRSDPQRRIPLAHGDVVVWGGPSRLVYHGVAKLKDGEHPALGRQRYNLTFRKAL